MKLEDFIEALKCRGSPETEVFLLDPDTGWILEAEIETLTMRGHVWENAPLGSILITGDYGTAHKSKLAP